MIFCVISWKKPYGRNSGIDRTIARTVNLTAPKIANAQRHNEREKESDTNPDVVPERLPCNIHFKTPAGSCAEMFGQMKTDGVISTRGLKDDAKICGELIFNVNSAYRVSFCPGGMPVSSRIGTGGAPICSFV